MRAVRVTAVRIVIVVPNLFRPIIVMMKENAWGTKNNVVLVICVDVCVCVCGG